MLNLVMKYLLIFLSFLLAVACSAPSDEGELAQLKQDLAQAQQTISKLKSVEGEGQLVHIVFFKLAADAEVEGLLAEIETLHQIEEVQGLEYGVFTDLGDQRALSDYGVVMSMSFEDSAAYARYQQDSIHLALKANAGAYLGGPPATYDFIKD